MKKSSVKKEDIVKVLAGKDRGKTGKVLRVLRGESRAIVERINMAKKHTRPNPQRNIQGGIMEKEASIDISNLRVVCAACGQTKGFRIQVLDDGRKIRACKACGGQVGKTS
jgi:large subunit ribosomal protein L24